MAEPPLKYLALGDSSSGASSRRKAWPSLLARRLAKATGRLVSLEIAGSVGSSTEELIRTELAKLDSLAPDFVTVSIGAADVEQGRSRAEYQAGLEWIYDSVVARGLAPGRAVAISIPQPLEGTADMERRAIEHFNTIARTEASARALAWVELPAAAAAVGDARDAAWAEAIWDSVREAWTAS
ncbi:MAG TPA: SGNH/GDSL hydrolase family protein [Candidatus Dormibacteraeota bacterium]